MPEGDESGEGSSPGAPGDDAGAGDASRRGRVRRQEPGSTERREPTLAEQRARQAAEQRQRDAERAELEAAERKSRARRRVMIGGGAAVGVVALVAAFYTAAQPEEYQRVCTAENAEGQLVATADEYCQEDYAQSHGGHLNPAGFWVMPFFLPGGTVGPPTQYRYSYTPAGSAPPNVGQPVRNPNFDKPDNARITTRSGSVVQRGGFGISGRSGSGGS